MAPGTQRLQVRPPPKFSFIAFVRIDVIDFELDEHMTTDRARVVGLGDHDESEPSPPGRVIQLPTCRERACRRVSRASRAGADELPATGMNAGT